MLKLEGKPLEISPVNLVSRTGARIGWVGATDEVNGAQGLWGD